jgi:hypothetical protein
VKQRSGSKKELDSYIEDIKDRQRNTVFPDVLRGGRSVDELLFKGSPNAPLVQRIGVMILAILYLGAAASSIAIAVEQGNWLIGVFAAIPFGVGGWFIRNAFRR